MCAVRFSVLCVFVTGLASLAAAYDDVNQTYFPILQPPSYVYNVATYGTSNQIAGMTDMIGDVSAAITFEFDVYIVSAGAGAGILFDFYKAPFYSGYARYTFNCDGVARNQWQHFSVPLSSLLFVGGTVNWSSCSFFQVRSDDAAGAFNVWFDNAGFFKNGSPVRVMIDGDNDVWGHNFTTAPVLGPPPAILNGNATHVVFNAGTVQFGNVLNGRKFNKLMIMLESLQGLLLKKGDTEGIHIEADSGYLATFSDLRSRRTFNYEYVISPKTPWWLVQHFKDTFGGRYMLFDAANPDSLSVARMAAYKYDAIIVETELETEAIANGLTKVIDVSMYDDQWIYDNWLATWPHKDAAIDQFTSGPYMAYLNDYAAATGPVCFRQLAGTSLRMAFLDALDEDSPVFGWPVESYGELYSTMDNSLHNTWWMAVASTHNTALYSAFRKSSMWPLQQRTHSTIVTEPNTHYVTFVWSDGDNISWHVANYLWASQWWASPDRGSVACGWPISPVLRDLMSTSVEYRYATAEANDSFFASGAIGYGYPSAYSPQSRAQNAQRTAMYMHDLDMGILMILDKYGFDTPEVYMPYMLQPQIDAIFYWDVWGDYARYLGEIKWVNRKPIISAYAILDQQAGHNSTWVANAIKARPRNPHIPEGYSMIGVGAWTSTMTDIKNCANALGAGYKVVTPEEFVSLVKQNLHPVLTISKYDIDLGSSQLGPYGTPTNPAFTVTTNSTQQEVDGTPSTKFTLGTTYAFSNMNFSPINITDANSFDVDIYGDGSGSSIRLELFSSIYSSFLYSDITLDFTGWRHYSWNLDGSDMLYAGSSSLSGTLSSINIFQVSGPWNGRAASLFIDNARIMVRNYADFNNDGTINELDVKRFASMWLTNDPNGDLSQDGTVNFVDWSQFARQW